MIVVEHDEEMILEADYVIDIGPKAGINGGKIIFEGTPKQMMKAQTITADYISKRKQIFTPKERRKGNGKEIILKGCTGNNLKNISVSFPLGKMIGVTGVSGSGKSTLINETLYPILNAHFFNAVKKPMPYQNIEGLEHVDKVIAIDQSPIGRTPRSNPATYTGVFSEIRTLFTQTPEAMIRGYKPGRFSFNVKGGRCETCEGSGLKVIEMNFLPDVYVECETCKGKRFNRETLEIRYKGKSIADVLDMTISESVVFFENIPKIYRHSVGELNIVPMAISYQIEPCDILKTRELYLSRDGEKYVKQPDEDLNSILTGITQPKGHVHISLGEPITYEQLPFDHRHANEFYKGVASLIDK